MKNLYWFTNDDGENILDDFCGTEKEAVEYAEKTSGDFRRRYLRELRRRYC